MAADLFVCGAFFEGLFCLGCYGRDLCSLYESCFPDCAGHMTCD